MQEITCLMNEKDTWSHDVTENNFFFGGGMEDHTWE